MPLIRMHAFQSASEEELLRLQRMETRLVDALLARPGLATQREEQALRYGLALAMLDGFQPGAAAAGHPTRRSEVRVLTPRLAQWRRSVLTGLEPTLGKRDARRRLPPARLWSRRTVKKDRRPNRICPR